MKPTHLLTLLLATVCVLHAQDEADRRPGVTTGRMLRIDSDTRALPLIPTPAETYWGRGSLSLGAAGKVELTVDLVGGAEQVPLLRDELAKRVEHRFGVAIAAGATHLVFGLAADANADTREALRNTGPEGYVVETTSPADGAKIVVTGNSTTALWHGMVTAAALIERHDGGFTFPELRIIDYPRMHERALLAEVGGQGYMVGPSRWSFDRWREFVDWMVDHKFNDLWLEFIGSGRLMGNLDMAKGEWVGFPLDLKSYPQLVGRDRPIKRWDDARHAVVDDRYTIPNVAHDFVHQLIDYAQARGVRCDLLIGYDYFANQLPVTLRLPANDPENPAANKFYDTVLTEIVQRYSNASGVVLHTIENKDVPPTMLDAIIRRMHDAERIVHAANPKMRMALLADYLEWRPPAELEHLKAGLPAGMTLAYTPHREPQQREWQRLFPDAWRYSLYTQYAWDHIAYILPEQAREEALLSYADGYRRMVSQMWYFDVFQLNYLALAEFAWNPTSGSADALLDRAIDEVFGPKAHDAVLTAVKHTRFDLRFDIIARVLLRPNIQAPFSFWDMYHMSRINGLTDAMLAGFEADARTSLEAAEAARATVIPSGRHDLEILVISAERRLYLATSARHLLKALALKKAGDGAGAAAEMDACIAEGEKMVAAATGLGIEFPMAVHDGKILDRYREIRAGLPAR